MGNMNEEKKIILPKDLQREMLKFFFKTSMLRIRKSEEKDKSAIGK